MEFLPQDPSKRKKILIVIGVGMTLVVFGFLFINYWMPETPADVSQISATGGSVSEGALKIIEGNVSALREELQSDFYRTLKRYKWTADTAAPGKENPFLE